MLNGNLDAASASSSNNNTNNRVRVRAVGVAPTTIASSNPLSVSMDNLSRLQQAALACQLDARTLAQVFGGGAGVGVSQQAHLPHSLQRSRSQQTSTISVTTKEKLKEMLLSRQRLRSNESTDDGM